MSAASKSPGGDQGNRTSRVSGTATDYGNTATTPPAPAITFDNIPNELKQYPHWVIWKYVLVPGKKPDKVLYSPIDGAKASHAPEGAPRWGTFDQALEAYNKPYGGWSGIGFVFSPEDPFTGIDFDGPENMGRWARRFDSYTELSPSGKGIHVIIRGSLMGPGRRHDGYEVYSSHRFFTMTGDRLPNAPAAINGRQKVLSEFVEDVFPPVAPRNTAPAGASHIEDDQLIERIRASKQGAKFDRLWTGDASGYQVGDEGPSRADGALSMLLAFWTNRDPAQIDRLFRQSGLMRSKWDERHGAETYGELTIRTAIEQTTEGYDPGNLPSTGESEEMADVGKLSTDPECAARVIQLEREVARLKVIENLYSLHWKVIKNSGLSATQKLVTLATLNVIQTAKKDRVDDKGRTATWRSEIARTAGVNEDTVSRAHKDVLVPAGFFDLEVETVKVERPDPSTGEIREMPTQQWYIRATDKPEALLDRVAAFTKAADAPKHGGKRERTCPDHPNAPIRVTKVTHYNCSVCDQLLDRERTVTSYIPVEVDANGDTDYLVEEQPETLSPQVAAIEEDPETTVDSLHSPQLADIEATENPWQQDAGIGRYIPPRQRDEVVGRHIPVAAGGSDD